MERIGDLMRQLGFREDASEEVKKAFIRNLVRAAAASGRAPAVESLHETIPVQRFNGILEEQLSFQFEAIDDAG